MLYCIDPQKRNRWHLNLCIALQELLGLPDPPHFLVPWYTATLDRWQHPRTGEIHISAEAYPPVWRYRSLLNVIFQVETAPWREIDHSDHISDLAIVGTYHQQFPQLWEHHGLVINLETIYATVSAKNQHHETQSHKRSQDLAPSAWQDQGCVLRLFISGQNPATEHALEQLHQVLSHALAQPYTLKVIDILKHPEQAEQDQILATPTLLRVWPKPVRRIVGDMQSLQTAWQNLVI